MCYIHKMRLLQDDVQFYIHLVFLPYIASTTISTKRKTRWFVAYFISSIYFVFYSVILYFILLLILDFIRTNKSLESLYVAINHIYTRSIIIYSTQFSMFTQYLLTSLSLNCMNNNTWQVIVDLFAFLEWLINSCWLFPLMALFYLF